MTHDFNQALDASENFERGMKVALMERILATPQPGLQPVSNHYDAYNSAVERTQRLSLEYLASGISRWPTLLDKLDRNGPKAEVETIDAILDEQLGNDPASFQKRLDVLKKASEYVGRPNVDDFMFIEYEDIDFGQNNLRDMANRINAPSGDTGVLNYLDARQTGSKTSLPNPWDVIRTKIPDEKIQQLVTALSDFQEKSEGEISFFGTPFGSSDFYHYDEEIRTARFQPQLARPLIDRLSADLDNPDNRLDAVRRDRAPGLSDLADQPQGDTRSPARFKSEYSESEDSSVASLEPQVGRDQNLSGLPADSNESLNRHADENSAENPAKRQRQAGPIVSSAIAEMSAPAATHPLPNLASGPESRPSTDTNVSGNNNERDDRARTIGR